MTLHAISGYIAPDSGMSESEVQTEIDDWVSKRGRWTNDPWRGTVDRLETDAGSPYLLVRIRFELDSDTKDNLLQKFGDKFANKVDWFRVLYHDCDHDAEEEGQDPPPCTWDEKRPWEAKDVTVPADVEAKIPAADTVIDHQ